MNLNHLTIGPIFGDIILESTSYLLIPEKKNPAPHGSRTKTILFLKNNTRNGSERDEYRDGIAIIVGKIWHRPDRNNLYLTFIDFDKQRGIDEVFTREDGLTLTLQQAAEKWIIEQHKGNVHKAHAYFYSPIPFPNKGPDEILGIEIKGQGEHGLAFCTPSIHQDNTPYEIIDTMEPQTLTERAARQLCSI